MMWGSLKRELYRFYSLLWWFYTQFPPSRLFFPFYPILVTKNIQINSAQERWVHTAHGQMLTRKKNNQIWTNSKKGPGQMNQSLRTRLCFGTSEPPAPNMQTRRTQRCLPAWRGRWQRATPTNASAGKPILSMQDDRTMHFQKIQSAFTNHSDFLANFYKANNIFLWHI